MQVISQELQGVMDSCEVIGVERAVFGQLFRNLLELVEIALGEPVGVTPCHASDSTRAPGI